MRAAWILLGVVLVLALTLRLRHLNAHGLWLDEQWTLLISSGNGGDYLTLPQDTLLSPAPRPTAMNMDASLLSPWTRPSADVHPPLYAVLVRAWRHAVGESDVSLRMISVVASMAAVVLTFLIGWRLFSPAAGLWAALIMAVAPQQIYYAQQARSYALATMFSLAAMWAMLRLQHRRGRLRFLTLALLVAASLLTHYFTAGLVLAMAMYALLLRESRWRCLAAIGVGIALFAITWLPRALTQQTANGNITGWLSDPDSSYRVLRMSVLMLKAPALLLGQRFGEALIVDSLLWLTLLGIAIVLLRRGHRDVVLAMLAFVVPLAQPAVIDLARSIKMLAEPRYLLPAMPGMCLLLGAAATSRRIGWVHLIPAAVVVVCLIAPKESYRQRYADFRPLAAPLFAASPTQKRYPIVLLEGGAKRTLKVWEDTRSRWVCLEKYLPRDIGPVILCSRQIPPETIAYLQKQPAFWVMWPSDAYISQSLPGARPLPGSPMASEPSSGKMCLYSFAQDQTP